MAWTLEVMLDAHV